LLTPVYLVQIGLAKSMGVFGSLFQLRTALGFVIGHLFNWPIGRSHKGWRAVVCAVPSGLARRRAPRARLRFVRELFMRMSLWKMFVCWALMFFQQFPDTFKNGSGSCQGDSAIEQHALASLLERFSERVGSEHLPRSTRNQISFGSSSDPLRESHQHITVSIKFIVLFWCRTF
jgi:hypothetical protein